MQCINYDECIVIVKCCLILTTGGALHNLSDQRHLLGPPYPPTPQTTGRPEADETAKCPACIHGGLAGAAAQVRVLRWKISSPLICFSAGASAHVLGSLGGNDLPSVPTTFTKFEGKWSVVMCRIAAAKQSHLGKISITHWQTS